MAAKKDNRINTQKRALGRRELMKLGVSAGAGTLVAQLINTPLASTQNGQRGTAAGQRSPFRPEVWAE
jgi:hypothetical protein